MTSTTSVSTTRVRVKFCGITRPQDAQMAVSLGVDALGLVFYPPSPRAVTVEQAQDVVNGLPAFVNRIGLFVNPETQTLDTVLSSVPLCCLQFHGEESGEQCRAIGLPYIKAVRMRPEVDLYQVCDEYHDAAGILLDSYQEGTRGGTGQVFDWSRIPGDLPLPVVLAGGLTPDNVATAIAACQPYAVDVSGGIEAEKGIKDHDKMNEFMRGVYSACF